MSMYTTVETGYGVNFSLTQFEDIPTLRKFVEQNCSERVCKLVIEMIDGELYDSDPYEDDDICDLLDALEDSDCEISEGDILADAMKQAYNIDMYATCDEDGNRYCLFLPAYPWEYKNMSRETWDLWEETLRSRFQIMVKMMTGNEPKDGCIGEHEVLQVV